MGLQGGLARPSKYLTWHDYRDLDDPITAGTQNGPNTNPPAARGLCKLCTEAFSRGKSRVYSRGIQQKHSARRKHNRSLCRR